MLLLAGCGGDATEVGRTGSGSTTPGPAPSGVRPADTPALTGSAGTNDPSRTPSALAGGTADPGGGLAGGTGTGTGVAPTASPGITALQILGIPVNLLPPDVVAAIAPGPDAGGGTNTDGGANNGGETTGGGTTGGGTTGGGTTGGGTTGGGTTDGGGTSGGGTTGGGTTGGGTTGGGTTGGGTTGGGTTGGGTSGGGGPLPIPTTTAFCGPAHDLSGALNAVGAARTPSEVEAAVSWGRQSFATAQATVPPGLSNDIAVLASAFGRLFDAMEAADYDLSRVKPSAFSGLTTSSARNAQDRFNQYVIEVC
jgi:hypothetical protein